jgi:hypothetical protein
MKILLRSESDNVSKPVEITDIGKRCSDRAFLDHV